MSALCLGAVQTPLALLVPVELVMGARRRPHCKVAWEQDLLAWGTANSPNPPPCAPLPPCKLGSPKETEWGSPGVGALCWPPTVLLPELTLTPGLPLPPGHRPPGLVCPHWEACHAAPSPPAPGSEASPVTHSPPLSVLAVEDKLGVEDISFFVVSFFLEPSPCPLM